MVSWCIGQPRGIAATLQLEGAQQARGAQEQQGKKKEQFA